MGLKDYGGLTVLDGIVFIFYGHADAGGIKVGRCPEQHLLQGDAESGGAGDAADSIGVQIIEGLRA